jgi:hypothetical protein
LAFWQALESEAINHRIGRVVWNPENICNTSLSELICASWLLVQAGVEVASGTQTFVLGMLASCKTAIEKAIGRILCGETGVLKRDMSFTAV